MTDPYIMKKNSNYKLLIFTLAFIVITLKISLFYRRKQWFRLIGFLTVAIGCPVFLVNYQAMPYVEVLNDGNVFFFWCAWFILIFMNSADALNESYVILRYYSVRVFEKVTFKRQ